MYIVNQIKLSTFYTHIKNDNNNFLNVRTSDVHMTLN